MADVLPYTLGAFAVAVPTRLLLFAWHALDYIHKAPFVAKMILCSSSQASISAPSI